VTAAGQRIANLERQVADLATEMQHLREQAFTLMTLEELMLKHRASTPGSRPAARPGTCTRWTGCAVNPLMLVLAFAGLAVSAQARLNAVILGQPVSVPVLGIVTLALVLPLAALVLWLLRSAVRDGGSCGCVRGWW